MPVRIPQLEVPRKPSNLAPSHLGDRVLITAVLRGSTAAVPDSHGLDPKAIGLSGRESWRSNKQDCYARLIPARGQLVVSYLDQVGATRKRSRCHCFIEP